MAKDKKNNGEMSDDDLESLLGFSLSDPLGEKEKPDRPVIHGDNPLFAGKDLAAFMAMTSEEIFQELFEKEAKDLNLPKEKKQNDLYSELEGLIDVLSEFTKSLPSDMRDVALDRLGKKLGLQLTQGHTLNLSERVANLTKKKEPTYYHVLCRGFMSVDQLKSKMQDDDDDENSVVDDILKSMSIDNSESDTKDQQKDVRQVPVGEHEIVLSSGEGLFVPSIVRNYICGVFGFTSATILNWREISKDEYDVEIDYNKSKEKNEIDDLIRSVGGY